MKSMWRCLSFLVAVPLLAGLSVPAARAAESDEVRFSIGLGSQLVSVDEDRDAKFQEYRDVPQGAILDDFSLVWTAEKGGWGLRLDGLNAFRLDERYLLTFGKPGLLRVRTMWDQTPHLFSNDGTFLLAGSPGNWTLSNVFRQEIEDQAIAGTVDTLMPDVLASSAGHPDMRLRRDRASTDLTLDLPAGWSLNVRGGREKREGLRRLGTGTYIRSSTAASFDAERFTVRGLEMPEPIDYRVNDFGLAATWSRKRGFFDVGLQGSRFSNEVDRLFWDNPFEAAPSVSSSSIGLLPAADQEPSAAQGNTSSAANRGRSAAGGLDLAPDNTWQRLHASGAFGLPGRTRINASYSIATMEQDDPFLPYTRNEAIIFDNGPDTLPGTADDILAIDLPTPVPSLDGEIRTTRGELRVSSRPADPLTLRAAWRSYEYDDRTDEIALPGYAAAGESYFRRGVGQLDSLGNKVLFNETGGYTRDLWLVGGAWRFGSRAVLDLEYDAITWDYDTRQVERTIEDVLQAKIRVTPTDWLTARLTWLDGSREFEGDYEVGLEQSGVRAFDVWDRERTRYGAELDFTPGDRWTFGVSYSKWEDEYPGSIETVTPHPYGLNVSDNESISGSLGFAGERFTVGATIGRDTSTWDSLAVTKTSFSGVNYQSNNRWSRRQDDTVDWGNIYFTMTSKDGRFRLIADLTGSLYDGALETTNEGAPDINSAVAYPFPDLSTDLFSGRLTARWVLNKNLEIEGRYWYEPFTMDDFMWDSVQPYMQGIIREARTSSTDIQNANVTRYLSLDSRYSDYTASVLVAVLRAHF